MLGKIPNGNDEHGARVVYNPCVVGFRIRDFRRKAETPVLYLPDTAAKCIKSGFQVKGSVILAPGKRRGIAGLQQINPVIIREKRLTGVKSGGRAALL